jgi:PAS domain S-box-containing protein
MDTSANNRIKTDSNLEIDHSEEIRQHLEPILKMATEICNVPFSVVHLIDDNVQNTLATYGKWKNSEITDIKSICGWLDTEKDVRVINNIREHPELKMTLSERDLETFGFYAGAPLKSKSGSRVGSLCLFDSEPRDLTDTQKECLRTLANETVLKLHYYELNNRLNEKERELKRQSIFLTNSTDITFLVQPESGKIIDVNSDIEQTLGYSPDSLLNTRFIDLVATDEKSDKTVNEWLTPEKKIDGRYSVDLQFIDKENKKRWFECNFTRENGVLYCSAKDINEQKEAVRGVHKLKEKFQKVVDMATDLVYELDWESKDLAWGDELTDILGYPHEERFVDYDWWIDKIHPDDLERVVHDVSSTLEGECEKLKMVYRIKTYDGSYKHVMNHNYVDRKKDGTPVKIIGAIVDISDLKEAKDQVEQREKLLEELADQTSTAIWIRDHEGKHLYMNQNYRDLFDLGEQKVIGKTVHDLFDKDTARQFDENDQKVMRSGESHLFDECVETNTGKRFYKTNIFPLNGNKVGGVSINITEEMESRKKLQNSVEEKETLLKEIHHRVKNNLAVVSGILYLQYFNEEDKELREKLLDSTNRIKTMATIHELLYQSLSFTNLKLDKNISKLINGITSSFEVSVDLDTTYDLEPIILNINQAIPLSLIINEVVTNVLKHAFDEGDSGTIAVTLFETDGEITLIIKDNGKGLPDDFEPKGRKKSLGLELIESLAGQLHAEYFYSSIEQGAQFKLTFKKEDIKGTGSSL